MAAVKAEARSEVEAGVEDADGVSIEVGLLVDVMKRFGLSWAAQPCETLTAAFGQPSRSGKSRICLEVFD